VDGIPDPALVEIAIARAAPRRMNHRGRGRKKRE